MQLSGSYNSRYFAAALSGEARLFQAPAVVSIEAVRRGEILWNYAIDWTAWRILSVSDLAQVYLAGSAGVSCLQAQAQDGQGVSLRPVWPASPDENLGEIRVGASGNLLCWESTTVSVDPASLLNFRKASKSLVHKFHLLDLSQKVPTEIFSAHTSPEETLVWSASPNLRYLVIASPDKKSQRARLINLTVSTPHKEYELPMGQIFDIAVNDDGIVVAGVQVGEERFCFFLGGRLRTPLCASSDYRILHLGKESLLLHFGEQNQLVLHPIVDAHGRDQTRAAPAQSGDIIDLDAKNVGRDALLHVDDFGSITAVQWRAPELEVLPVRILEVSRFWVDGVEPGLLPPPLPPVETDETDDILLSLFTTTSDGSAAEPGDLAYLVPERTASPTVVIEPPLAMRPPPTSQPSGAGTSFLLPPSETAPKRHVKPPSWLHSTPAVVKAPDLRPGAMLGQYQLGNLIGAGGMGQVYRARDTRLLRDVALKVMSESGMTDVALQRFLLEARAVARISHPGVVTIHDVVTEPIPYIVMELLEGTPLGDIPRDEIPPSRAIALVRQVLQALQAVHDAGITHRDIKPANIMVCRRDQVVMMDFGLAKLAGQDLGLTQAGGMCGTPAAMAPEQLQSEFGPVDGQTDIFAVAGLLYELVCGVPPFTGDTLPILLMGILLREVTPPQDIQPGLSDQLSQAILTGLQKQKALRFKDCLEFLQSLEGLTG